jgi:uncharacterized protein YjiS (DUF1127 family)
MNGTHCAASPLPAVRLQPRSPALAASVLRALDIVLLWHERARSRRMLAALDDRMLRDVGIDHATARQESERPFWR